jgi:hypothetical protein
MKPIIPKVPRELIESELTEEKFLRQTNNVSNHIFIVTGNDSPNTIREIGRLRELTFRSAGGGSGNEADLDEYDFGPFAYKQLIVWDPDLLEIVGGYRFILCNEAEKKEDGSILSATADLFEFSSAFLQNYLPHTIELGRSFVQPSYQSAATGRKGIFALDNLWDGLGALIVANQAIRYLFGKVTMYPHFNVFARDLILYFMRKYFSDNEEMVKPKNPVKHHHESGELGKLLHGKNYKEDYKLLSKKVRSLGESIPPLINSYMNLSPSMKFFGTSVNHKFGNVEESAILITLKDIYLEKILRHVKDCCLPEKYPHHG